jgi:hypothetical protein
MRFNELPVSAQTAYAELAEQTRAFEAVNALGGLQGSFQKLDRKGRGYWYFAFRDLDGKVRLSYVGPDDERVQALVRRFEESREARPLSPQAQAAIALGGVPVPTKHFRIVKRLGDHGFFRAGGVLVGTHAFVAFGNMLGVKWTDGVRTLDVDFAPAAKNVSIALPADIKIDVHGAFESLEMGLMPITELGGGAAAQLRLDFVTSATRYGKPVLMQDVNLALRPLKFMEFSLEGTTQACVFGSAGACTVNIPAPERYAVHKLVIFGERAQNERAKARKDLLQAWALIDYHRKTGQARLFNTAWRDAVSRGRGWRSRAHEGRRALLATAPELDDAKLWKES